MVEESDIQCVVRFVFSGARPLEVILSEDNLIVDEQYRVQFFSGDEVERCFFLHDVLYMEFFLK